MISELLGSDFPNCSSVPEDMNSMHNDIGLHNGEVPPLTAGIRLFININLSNICHLRA